MPGVTPLELINVCIRAFLKRFPGEITTKVCRDNLNEVKELGQFNSLTTPSAVPLKDILVFCGYNGTPLIRTPPRFYLQVVLAMKKWNNLTPSRQLPVLTALSVALFDVGIGAWL